MTTLFHASDLHFGGEDRAALAWFEAAVAAQKPDAVLITGDLTLGARSAEFAAAERWLGGLGVPVSIEPGNHDIPWRNPVERLFRPYRRFEALSAAVESVIALPDLLIVPLKTTARVQARLNWAEGRVDPASLDDALAAIGSRAVGTIAIVTCHHPLVDPAGLRVSGRTAGGAEAAARLAAAGASVVLSGHVHDGFDWMVQTDNGPLRCIGAGTLSERVRATRPSFNQLQVENGSITRILREMESASVG